MKAFGYLASTMAIAMAMPFDFPLVRQDATVMYRTNYSAKGDPNNLASLSDACKKEENIIETRNQLHELQKQCKILLGSLVFDKVYNDNKIDLEGITQIQGHLVVRDNSKVSSIRADYLNTIGGDFVLSNLTGFSSIDTPALNFIENIDWQVVPIMGNLKFGDNLQNVTSVTISDTSLTNLDFLSKLHNIEIFDVNNNRFLEYISSNLETITEQLRVHANADDLELAMPRLGKAHNISVRDSGSVRFPELREVSSSLELIDNTFKELNFSKLQKVEGTIALFSNDELNRMDFNEVTGIGGGLMIVNNTELNEIDCFDQLRQIGGAIQFEGTFSNLSFPKLKLVKGSAYINSPKGTFDCSPWTSPTDGRSIVRGGKVQCISQGKKNTLKVDEDGAVTERGATSDVNDKTAQDIPRHERNYSENSAGISRRLSVPAITIYSFLLGLMTITIM